MVLLILINIIVIVLIYMKYYKFTEFLNYTEEIVETKDSMIIGYINDMGFSNNFDLIIAQIIELNIKGYIIIDYNKDNIEKYDYIITKNTEISSDNLKKHQMLILNFLFSNNTQITKKELEEKLNNTFNSYNTQFNEIANILNEQLIEENIIDKIKQKELTKNTKRYIKISIILTLFIIIFSFLGILKNSLLYMLIYFLEIILSSVLLLKASIYTNKGQIIKYNIDSYRITLENKEFLTSQNTMKEIVSNKEFANSIALHINTQAKKAFIDDGTTKESIKITKKTIINILTCFIILVLIGLIIAQITVMLPKGAIFWVYLILAISVACVADITLYKKNN